VPRAALGQQEHCLRAVRSGAEWLVNGETAPVLGAASAEVLIPGAQAEDPEGGTVWFALDASQRAGVSTVSADPVDPRSSRRSHPLRSLRFMQMLCLPRLLPGDLASTFRPAGVRQSRGASRGSSRRGAARFHCVRAGVREHHG
jgi:hypothetical protein